MPRKIGVLLEFFFPSTNSREIFRLLKKYWAQIEKGLTKSASCMQHATATALSLLLPTPNLGGGFEFSPAIVVCKIDVLKIVPFFCAGGGEGKERCWVGRVGVVCGYISGDLLFVLNS